MDSVSLQRYRATRKATFVGAGANIILAVIKVTFGWLGHSSALIADGIHSFSDLITDFLVILAAKFAHHDPDEDHPYGHERIETAATVALSLLLIIVGLAIAYDSMHRIWIQSINGHPDVYILWVAAFSIIVNELIYRYTLSVAKRIKSDILHANALHSRSDAASSIVVLIGVGGSLFGIPWLDAAAAIIVGAMIVKMGVKIGWQNLSELIDTGVDEKTLKQIREQITHVSGVEAIHQLRTRKMAGQILIDVHIIVPPYVSVSEGHHIGDQVLKVLYEGVKDIRDVTVHVDPEDDELYSQSASLPVRKVLLPRLQQVWKTLPGADEIKEVVFHYLAGNVEVVVILPLSVLKQEQDINNLRNAYQQAVSCISEIGHLQLQFS